MRERHAGQRQIMGTKTFIGKGTSLQMMLSGGVRVLAWIRLWPLRRDDSSRALIGAGGMRRSDWLEHVWAFGVSARSDR